MKHASTLTIGLVGGIASGKSHVGKLLAERGAVVLAADEVAHGVLAEAEVREALVSRLGPQILTSTGDIDRGAVARLVFGDSDAATENRRYLEQMVHPRTRKRLEAIRELHRAQGASVFVIDAPLLLEAGWGEACDRILFVDAPLERRRHFARERGWEAGEIDRREQAQMPLAEKRARADWVIDNSGPLAALELQVNEFWRQVVDLPTENGAT